MALSFARVTDVIMIPHFYAVEMALLAFGMDLDVSEK